MDRPLVYPGQVPRALDNLNLGEFAMVGLAKLAEAAFGTATVVSQGGFAVTPGTGLSIVVAAGQIYQLEPIEPTAESALNANGTQVLKQGVALTAQTDTLALTAAVGQAQNFLLEVAYADVPDGSLVLSYQNPTPVLDPTTGALKYTTFPGPGGNGQANFTILRGGVSLQIKAGTPATSGSQTTPAPDAGYVGLFVITLAYGATSVSSGNITQYSAAPFLPVTLPGVPAGVQSGVWAYGVDTGAADNYVVALNPAPTSLTTGMRFFVKFAHTNATVTPVINVSGLGNVSLLKAGGTVPAIGDIPANGWKEVFFDGAAIRFSGSLQSDTASQLGTLKSIQNVVPVRITGRTVVTGSVANAFTTAWSGTYTKKSATSALLVFPNVNLYNAAAANTGVAPTILRLSAGSATPIDTFAQVGFQITNGAGGTLTLVNNNAGPSIVLGLSAGAQTISLQLARADSASWTAILNPTSSDNSAFPTSMQSTLIIAEVEP